MIVSFLNKVAGSARRNLLAQKYDGTLQGDLANEMPGIMNRVISLLQPENFAKVEPLLREPLLLSGAKKGLLKSIDDSPILSFIKEYIIFHPSFSTKLGVKTNSFEYHPDSAGLFNAFIKHCEEIGAKPMGLNRFSNLFLEISNNRLNLNYVKKTRPNQGRHLQGVLLFNQEHTQPKMEIQGMAEESPILERVLLTPSKKGEYPLLKNPTEVLRILREEDV